MSLPYLPETVELFPHTMTATVDETLIASAPGRVEFQASYWFAEFYQGDYGKIEPGTVVRVLGRRGLTLLVLPLTCEICLHQKFRLSQEITNASRSLSWLQWFCSVFA